MPYWIPISSYLHSSCNSRILIFNNTHLMIKYHLIFEKPHSLFDHIIILKAHILSLAGPRSHLLVPAFGNLSLWLENLMLTVFVIANIFRLLASTWSSKLGPTVMGLQNFTYIVLYYIVWHSARSLHTNSLRRCSNYNTKLHISPLPPMYYAKNMITKSCYCRKSFCLSMTSHS